VGCQFQLSAEARGPIRTVLIDDSETALRNITGFLQTLPEIAVVGTATSGAEAVELSRALRPDLALLDVQMPGMNGFEACQKMLAAYPETCIVMISVHGPEQVREACLATGARNFITKTRLSADLPPVIAELARKRTPNQQSTGRETP
jgi:two-component system, NarL family, response regulator DesR